MGHYQYKGLCNVPNGFWTWSGTPLFMRLLIFDFQDLPDMVAIKDADFSNVDAVFCCLPHGTTQVTFCSVIISYDPLKQYLNAPWSLLLESEKMEKLLNKYENLVLLLFNTCCGTNWVKVLNNWVSLLQDIIKALPRSLKIVDLSAVCLGCTF